MKDFENKTKNYLMSIKNFFKINPHKHWEFLLYVFFILITLLILWSLYLLYEIKNEQIFQIKPKPQESGTLLKNDLLKKTLRDFDQKTKNSQTRLIYEDPS